MFFIRSYGGTEVNGEIFLSVERQQLPTQLYIQLYIFNNEGEGEDLRRGKTNIVAHRLNLKEWLKEVLQTKIK